MLSRVAVAGAGGSGQATCPADGAADCRAGGGSGHGEDGDAADPVDAGAGMVAADERDWLADGVAATFGLDFAFGLGWAGAACASWVASVAGGG
jgi:hypothetical protein